MGVRFLTEPVIAGSLPSKVNPYQSGQRAHSQSIASSFQPSAGVSFNQTPRQTTGEAYQASPGFRDYLLNIPQSVLGQASSIAGHGVGYAGDVLSSGGPPPAGFATSLGLPWILGQQLRTAGRAGREMRDTPLVKDGWFGQSTAPLATRETFEAAEGIPASTLEAVKFAVEETPEALTYWAAIMAAAPFVVVSEIDRIARDRALNDGRNPDQYTIRDQAASALPAIANVYLERLGIKYGLGRAPQFLQRYASTNPAIRIATAGVAQAGIEAIQEGIEYPATVLGTQTPYDPQEALARSKMGAIAGALPGAMAGTAGEVMRQVAPVDRATAADMAVDIRDIEAPGVELRDREVRLETPVPEAEMEDGTIPYYTERQGVYQAPTPAEYNMAGTTEVEAQPGKKIAFIQTIYDNETRANNNKAPSRYRMRQALREVILEEGVSHSQLLEALTDKVGFLNNFYDSRSSDIDTWMTEDSSGIPYGEEYSDRVSTIEESSLTPEQKTESIRSLQRGLAAEYIAEIGRTEGLSSSNFRFVLKQIQSAIKRALGVNVSPYSNAEIVELLILARNNSRKGIKPGINIGGDLAATLASKKGFDPSRRRFLKQVGGAAAGIAADPRMILEPATPIAPLTQGLTDVVVPDIDTIYKFDIAVDPNAGWTSSDDPSEGSMEVTFNYEANQELIEVYEGDELVDTINIAENQEDVDSLVVQYVNDEYGSRNVNSVHDPIRDPAEEGGDDGGPLTESEMDAFFNDADASYKQQAQNMVAGELARKIEPGQRESFAQMVEEGTVRIPERSSAYDYFDESATPRLPEPVTPRLLEPATPRLPAPVVGKIDETRLAELEAQLIKNVEQLKLLKDGVVPPGFEGEYSSADRDQDIRTTQDTIDTLIEEIGEIRKAIMRRDMGVAEDVPQIDNRRKTAIEKATAPNLHIRNSDLRMNAIKENWEDNKNDLSFRRDYANFEEFEQAEWDLNYDMWIDEFQEAESLPAPETLSSLPTRPLTTQDRVNLEEAGEADALALSVDNIYSTFDEDHTVADAIENGTLDNLVRMEAQNSNFTRQELWDAVNARQATLKDIDVESERRVAARDADLSALPRARMTDAEVLNRDVRNEATKKYRKAINNSEISDDDKADRRKLLKNLLRPWGAEGIKRNLTPGDRDTFRQYAQMIVDGELDAVREFVQPFLDQIAAQKAPSKTKIAQREYYAGYKGVSASELAEYRERGKTHPMEKKMTYPFADGEIDRLEAGGEITVEEAENRRRVARELRSALRGKLPQTVKRKLTEIVYGIEDYANITPWTDKYTATEIEGMEERAEVAQAEARRTRYEKTKLTSAQKSKILDDPITEEERTIIDAMEGDLSFENLTTPRERLLFLREPASMSAAERAELNAFLADIKGFDQEKYREEKAVTQEEQLKDIEVERIPAKEGDWTPQKDRMLWKQGKNIRQVGQSEWDTLESSDEYTHAGETYTSQGERITEEEGFEFLDNELSSLAAYNMAGTMKRPKVGDGVKMTHFNPVTKKRSTSVGTIVSVSPENPDMILITFDKKGRNDVLVNWRNDGLERHTVDAHKKLRQEVFAKSFAIIKKLFVTSVEHQALKDLGSNNPRGIRANNAKILKVLQDERAGGANNWDIDHIIAISIGGMNFAVNLMPLPRWANRALSNKTLSSILESDTTNAKKLKLAFEYMEKKKNWENSSELQVIARAFDYANDPHAKIKAYSNLADINLPDGGVILSHEFYKGKKGLDLRLALYANQKFAFKDQQVELGMDWDIEAAQLANIAKNFEVQEKKIHEKTLSSWKSKDEEKAGYTEHFSDKFWYRLTSFLWGKPVQAIRDFNKFTRFGLKRGTIEAADEIADNIQRAHSSTQRTEGMEKGTDLVQDISMRTGEFFSILSKTFARATDNEGVIDAARNKQLIDHLAGKVVDFTSKEIKEAAYQLEALVRTIYKYAKTETKGLESALDLRGHGDSLVPRVWNIEYIATRRGKAKFLRFISAHFSPPGKTTPVFESADIVAEDLYDVVINSGGFVQGEWTNIKADQTRTEKDIAKDLAIQEYLDSLQTENLIDEGLLLDDLQAIMPRFVQKAVERTEYSKRFGKNDEILRDLIKQGIDQIREHNRRVLKMKKGDEKLPRIDEKRFEQSVWDMSRILRNKYGYDMANMPTRKWLQRAQNIQVVAKLPLVTLASMPEFFTPMLRGDVRPDKWVVDFLGATAWAGYKGMNGMSKLLFNTHLPAMRKKSSEIGGLGIIRDIALLRELGIADIQAMGDLVSTRYANPNFARGGLRAGAKGTLAGKVPKRVRAVFNMQTYMQATFLTTMTEMQQYIALRNFQRHVSKRLKFIAENKGKKDTSRRRRLLKQFRQDLLDYGITDDINLDTSNGLAEFNAGALRFVDQVITRPNDATTAKIFKNPLTAPLVLFKRFITTYGNTLLTAVGNDIAHKVDNVERAKQVGKVAVTAMTMYGAVMFAEIMRGAIMGDLDEDDFKLLPDDFQQFMRRIDRTGLSAGPGALLINLAFPYKRGWWDTAESRITGELFGPIFGDATALGDALLDDKNNKFQRLMRQLIPLSRVFMRSNTTNKTPITSNFEAY